MTLKKLTKVWKSVHSSHERLCKNTWDLLDCMSLNVEAKQKIMQARAKIFTLVQELEDAIEPALGKLYRQEVERK